MRALLTRPGFLTNEWREGRRVRWTHPFRLYLLASVLMFAMGVFGPDAEIAFLVDMEPAAMPAGFEASREISAEVAQTFGPQVLFVLVPLFAALFALFFRAPGVFYVEHLVHAFHLHAVGFAWVALILAGLLAVDAAWLTVPKLAVGLALPVYVVWSARRVYGRGWIATTVRSAGLMLVYVIVALLAFAFTVALASDSPIEVVERIDRAYWDVRAAPVDADSAEVAELRDDVILRYQRLEAYQLTPHVRAHFAELLLADERPEDALPAVREALVTDAAHPLALGIAARASEALGHADAARDYWSRLRAALPERRSDEARAPHAGDLAKWEVLGRERAP